MRERTAHACGASSFWRLRRVWWSPITLIEGNETEGIPIVVGFVGERLLSEEARLVLVFALHVEALSVRVVVVPFLGFVKPRAFDGAGVLVVAHVNVV